jgi:hypothetical protein
MKIKLFKTLLFNYFLIILPLYSISFPLLKFIGFSISRKLPSFYTIIFQLFIFLILEDFTHVIFNLI